MAHPEGPSISNPSISTPPGKPTTPNPNSTRQDQSLKGRTKKLSLMHGMATTVYPYIPMTDTSQPSSHPGAAIDTAQPHKATSPQVMDTSGGMMRSLHPSQTKQSVWITPYYGLTQLKRKLLPGMQLVGHLWQTGHYPQPREVQICRR